MKITHRATEKDPVYPIMEGDTPLSKEFNSRMKDIWAKGVVQKADFELIHTVIMEIMADDYNRRHAPRTKKLKDNE